MTINREIPNLTSELRNSIVTSPPAIRGASGIKLFGKRIKSIVYSTDVAAIANCDADAILAVYPWTPNTRILDAISRVANVPILAGVGGGLTKGLRSATVARFAEENGAQSVVVNAPASLETIQNIRAIVDVPIFYTVVNQAPDLNAYIAAGVSALNVAGGSQTAALVRWIRESLDDTVPNFPIIASGGKTDAHIQATIAAGANAITYTAYGVTEKTFQEKMAYYRAQH
ncbi:beta/alpha barrel domain-containing protein [Lacticaseibacillus daqingensis]|uniref:hydrolase n=1 Tax=Lacticaseibacillus daqingensis TaxID=2486014 RepID=UPI000F786945|nr:hydrolase [Lacticaseibacillus daqingensis]